MTTKERHASSAKAVPTWLSVTLITAAWFIVATGVLKIASPPDARGMDNPDPVFLVLKVRWLVYGAGAAELLAGGWVALAKARSLVAVRVFLCLLLAIGVYRGGLMMLAPTAPCHCGGLGMVGLEITDSVPGWLFTSLLLIGACSATAVMLFHSRRRCQSGRHSGTLRLLVPILLLFSGPRYANGVEPKALFPSWPVGLVLEGKGHVIVSIPANKSATRHQVDYPTTFVLGDKSLLTTTLFPNGGKVCWLLHRDVGFRLTMTSNTWDRAAHAMTNAGRLLYTGAVESLQDSFGDATPEALLYLALFGAQQAAHGGYLKPIHMLWTEPLAWMENAEVHAIRQPPNIASNILFRVARTDKSWARARRCLHNVPHASQLLNDLKRMFRYWYPDGWLCAQYTLMSTTNIAGLTLPTLARYQVYLPPSGGPASPKKTNQLGSTRSLRLTYSVQAGLRRVEPPTLPGAIDVQDTRAVTLLRRKQPAFYQLNRMAIPSTNSTLFQNALRRHVPMSSTELSARIKRYAICAGLVLVALLGLWPLLTCWRARTKSTNN